MGSTDRGDQFPMRPAVVLVFLLFLVPISMVQIIGQKGNARLFLMIRAAFFVVPLALTASWIAYRGRVVIDRKTSPVLLLFLGSLSVTAIGGLIGIARDYSRLYVIGDIFKFAVPVVTIGLITLVAEDRRDLKDSLVWVHAIYPLFFGSALLLYATDFLAPNDRISVLAPYAIMIVVSWWAFDRGIPLARVTLPLYVLAVPPLVYLYQSMSYLLTVILLPVLTVVFYYGVDFPAVARDYFRRHRVVSTVGGAILGVMALFTLLSLIAGTESYLQYKFTALVAGGGVFQTLVRVTGSRAVEPMGIIQTVTQDVPIGVLFGAGMGGTYVTPAVGGPSTWSGVDHYVHSGLWEAVLRTGIVGGALYFGLSVVFFVYAFRIRKQGIIEALAAAMATKNKPVPTSTLRAAALSDGSTSTMRN